MDEQAPHDATEATWRRKEAFRRATGFSLSKIDRWVRDGRIEKRDLPDESGRLAPHFRLTHQIDAPPDAAVVRDALHDALSRLAALEEENRRLAARIDALEGAQEALRLSGGDASHDAPAGDAADAPPDDAARDAAPLRRWWRQWSWRRP